VEMRGKIVLDLNPKKYCLFGFTHDTSKWIFDFHWIILMDPSLHNTNTPRACPTQTAAWPTGLADGGARCVTEMPVFPSRRGEGDRGGPGGALGLPPPGPRPARRIKHHNLLATCPVCFRDGDDEGEDVQGAFYF
jgi:hypothetical protein